MVAFANYQTYFDSELVRVLDVFVFVGGKCAQIHVHLNHHTATIRDPLNLPKE